MVGIFEADTVAPRRRSDVFTDGTTLFDLVDQQRREVALRVFNDPQLHVWELDRIFARSWVIVGHESEIPNPGDYVLRSIGEDPVIVTRNRDGGVTILLNICAHRAMAVCRADEGNASQFKCPYHGWVFDTTGKLIGSPHERAVHGSWDKSDYGLRTARAAVRHGVIFGCFDESTEPLDEWLGDIAWYFDEMFGQKELDILGPPHRLRVSANWKAAATQIAGDGLHTFTLHHALSELGFEAYPEGANDAKTWGLEGVDVSTRQGHAVRCVEQPGYAVDGDQRGRLPGRWFIAGVAFPNSTMWSFPFRLPHMDEDLTTASIGGLAPRGDGSYEEWRIQLIEKDAADELKYLQRTVGKIFDTIVLADDVETFVAATDRARGAMGRRQTLKFNALTGDSVPPDWPGPGQVHGGIGRDDNQWDWWLAWLKLMTE